MTRQELKTLYHLNREIETHTKHIAELKDLLENRHRTTDTVRGSATEYPFTERIFKIEGTESTAEARAVMRELEKARALVGVLKRQAAREYRRLLKWVDSIEDAQTREIIVLRYVNGLSWQQVAASVGGGNTADSVRKVAARYLKARGVK